MTEVDDANSTPLSRQAIMAIFMALLVAMFAAALDQTVVATALPTIVGDLDGATHMLWVTTAYVLASTVAMPIYGKLGDLIGRRSLFLGALALFAVGSVACALAPAMAELIAGRAIQGLGGGGLIILSQAIVADVVPPRRRAWYLSIMGIAYAVPTVAGPSLGRLLHRHRRLALGLLDEHSPLGARHFRSGDKAARDKALL